jgi:hypothetical protein
MLHTYLRSNNHAYGTITGNMKLLKICNKSTTMNCWEDLLIPHYKSKNILIEEQKILVQNPMFKLARCDHGTNRTRHGMTAQANQERTTRTAVQVHQPEEQAAARGT